MICDYSGHEWDGNFDGIDDDGIDDDGSDVDNGVHNSDDGHLSC
jgi:hypothetical protein